MENIHQRRSLPFHSTNSVAKRVCENENDIYSIDSFNNNNSNNLLIGTSNQIFPPALFAKSENQKKSLAELPKPRKYCKYNDITTDNRKNYHDISCRPITKTAEDDMELVSDIITWGELYLHHWDVGIYKCSRCFQPLYHSRDKWKGPCVWPSFRKPIEEGAISTTIVYPYNNYTVTVSEVYCGKCDLFIGHQFEDGRLKGDSHPEARWRH